VFVFYAVLNSSTLGLYGTSTSQKKEMVSRNPYDDKPRVSVDEERKAMLSPFDSIDLPRVEDGPEMRPKSRRFVLPFSLGANLLLFVVILFQLAHPCFFSARTCVYEKREKAQIAKEVVKLESMKTELMGDLNKIVPDFPTQRVTFTNDSHYANENMFKSEKEFNHILTRWEKDMPLGRGFVTVQNSTSYPSLSQPWHLSSVPGKDGYSIAYLHQYHCIYMIMRSHGQYRFGRPPHDADAERHVTHCFDYLRQSVYCAGDSTLEGKSREEGLEMTDGWGDMHVCKNSEKLLGWVLKNRFSNKTGIH